MFNVYGFLFWEPFYPEVKGQKIIKILFPKLFVFISQYPYFKYFSYLSQNILSRIRLNLPFEIPLEVQLYNIGKNRYSQLVMLCVKRAEPRPTPQSLRLFVYPTQRGSNAAP